MYIFLRQRKYDSTFIKTTYGLIDLVDCDFDVFVEQFSAVKTANEGESTKSQRLCERRFEHLMAPVHQTGTNTKTKK